VLCVDEDKLDADIPSKSNSKKVPAFNVTPFFITPRLFLDLTNTQSAVHEDDSEGFEFQIDCKIISGHFKQGSGLALADWGNTTEFKPARPLYVFLIILSVAVLRKLVSDSLPPTYHSESSL